VVSDISDQLKVSVSGFKPFSIVVEENTDFGGVTQLAVCVTEV
jgi:hypothetical protein